MTAPGGLPGRLAARLVAALYRALYRSLRIVALLPDGSLTTPSRHAYGREVFALCERDALLLAGVLTEAPFTVLVAKGKDGDLATAVLEALGVGVVRGATGRGGTAALRGLLERLSTGDGPGALVVDGPLGPTGHAQPGIVLLGQRTGRPVRPLGAAALWRIRFRKTWSGIYLPLPFSRAVIVVGEPLRPEGDDRASIDERTQELSRRLASARERSLALLASQGAGPPRSSTR